MPHVLVPAARIERWVENFTHGHGPTHLTVTDGRMEGRAADGSTFSVELPFGRRNDALPDLATLPDVATLPERAEPPARWGVLLVRKGGYAIARLERESVVGSKTGQRHVQGRTKAGGQSQQRFARRRDNQARVAYQAAADHAARILTGRLECLVTGGDHVAVDAVLDDHRLRPLAELVVEPWLAVPDPRRAVLEQAVRDAMSLRVEVVNA